jgi:prevent-host-death family protein
MQVSVTEAKGKLTDLVRRAEAGEEVMLTRHGHPAVLLVAVAQEVQKVDRRAILEKFMRETKGKVTPGSSAARSADFLYDEAGLPA